MPTPEQREKYLQAKYGISLEQYNEMVAFYGGRCWICRRERKPIKNKPRRPLNVDHDHKTKRVRGVLCYTCNHFMLARGCDHPDLHDQAAVYLRSSFDGRNL